MRSVIQLGKLLLAKLNSLVHSAHVPVILLRCREVCLKLITSDFNMLALEQVVEVFIANLVMDHVLVLVLDFHTLVLDNRVHVIFANEL